MEVRASPPQAGRVNQCSLLPLVLGLASASASAQSLVVELFDYTDLPAKRIERFREIADLALAHSGIQLIWQYCRGALPAPAGSTCEKEMGNNEIAVRILPGVPGGPGDGRILHLGNSVVSAEGGHYASVFAPAIRAQAAEFGLRFELMLGYAVAHEVGHCLLGPEHSSAGLMRAVWNRKDAEEISRLSLHLTKDEARRAVARLTLAARR